MSAHSRRHQGGIPATLLAVLLLAPPALNIAYREVWPRLPHVRREQESELARLRVAVREAGNDVRARELENEAIKRRLAAVERARGRFPELTPRVARVLPIADPSPRRHAIWLAANGQGRLPANAAVVSDGALIGVVCDVASRAVDSLVPESVGGVPLARVRTTLDPGFRVRARVGSVWGFVAGTGDVDARGVPLLELRLLSADALLEPGTPVVTEGADGRHPGGIAIGTIVGPLAGGPEDGFFVRAELSPALLSEAVVLVDPVLESVHESVLESTRRSAHDTGREPAPDAVRATRSEGMPAEEGS